MGVAKRNVAAKSLKPFEDVSSTKRPVASVAKPFPTTISRPLDELLDVNQAAKILGISPKTLRDHVLHRRIDYVKLRGRVLFRPDRIWDLIERNSIPARAQ